MGKGDESHILKKMRQELGNEPWRTQYPSSAVSWRIAGDRDQAMKYQGDAKRLLWSVKNRMGSAGLKSFEDSWRYSDGTVIRAQSFYGQDIVTISTAMGEAAAVGFEPIMATWVRADQRIYFYAPTLQNHFFIDLSSVVTDIEEAYLLKTLENNGFMGVLVYYTGTTCKAIKFECLRKAADPIEEVTWQANNYIKSEFDYITDSFSAIANVSGLEDVTLDTRLLNEATGFSGAVPEWHRDTDQTYIPAPKCISVWMPKDGPTNLENLEYEIAALLLDKWYFRVCSTWPGWEHWCLTDSLWIDYLVYYRNGTWVNGGKIFEGGLAFVNYKTSWGNPAGVVVELLLNTDRYQRNYVGTPAIKYADIIIGAKKIWPVMNDNGIGVLGYWCVYETRYGQNVYENSDTIWLEYHEYYWWTPTDVRTESSLYGETQTYDSPSIDGNGHLSRAMSRKAPNVGSLSQYRIDGIYYENNQTIPDEIFLPDLYPYGRVAIEMPKLLQKCNLNSVPVQDITVSIVREWGPSYYPSVSSNFSFEGKMRQGKTDQILTGTTKYGVYDGSKYLQSTKFNGCNPKYFSIPGSPYADKLCWFGLAQKR